MPFMPGMIIAYFNQFSMNATYFDAHDSTIVPRVLKHTTKVEGDSKPTKPKEENVYTPSVPF